MTPDQISRLLRFTPSLLTMTGSTIVPAIVCVALVVWLGYQWLQHSRSRAIEQDMMYLASVTVIVNLLTIPYSWSYNHALLVLPILVSTKAAWNLPYRSRLLFMISMIGTLYLLPALVHESLTLVYESEVFQLLHVIALMIILLLVHHADRRRTNAALPGKLDDHAPDRLEIRQSWTIPGQRQDHQNSGQPYRSRSTLPSASKVTPSDSSSSR